MTKEKEIKAEIGRLEPILQIVAADKKHIATRLVENIAFMSITLADLQKRINKEGSVIVSTTGNGFEVTQENPAQKAYNTMIKNYNSSVRELTNMLPTDKAEAQAKAGEALKAFIKQGK